MVQSRRRSALALVLALVLGSVPAPARAQGFGQFAFVGFTTDVTITTTTEKDVVYSGGVLMPRDTATVCIIAWAQVTTGSMTTALTPKIRRGTGITGTVVGEANAEQVKAAAGSTEPLFYMACEDRSGVASVDYSFTVTQTGASANGAALSGGILVLVR